MDNLHPAHAIGPADIALPPTSQIDVTWALAAAHLSAARPTAGTERKAAATGLTHD